MNKIDRMLAGVDPAADQDEPALSQGMDVLLEEIVATPPAHRRASWLPGRRATDPELAHPSPASAATAPRQGRSPLRRRLLAGAAVTGIAAAAVVAVPLLAGTQNAAYAVVKQTDGTIRVTVRELREPDELEAKLEDAGIPADVTFTEAGKRCAPGRFAGADLAYDPPSTANMTERERREFDKPENWRSRDAARPIDRDTFVISPEYIRRGETLVLEFRPGNHPGVVWTLGTYLAKAGSPIAPCALVDAESDEAWVKEMTRPTGDHAAWGVRATAHPGRGSHGAGPQ
ncbi:hypothetical protein AAH991_05320 [Microbispora sp. ZYX-F-249]|uniref:Uncharacterized protein n=1 Tax=Microbispora maris TaxID=3144104 RepID=A0ABV0AGP1_9ACTN